MKKSTVLVIIYFALMFLFSLWFTSCRSLQKTQTVTTVKDSIRTETSSRVIYFVDTTSKKDQSISIVEIQFSGDKKDTVRNTISFGNNKIIGNIEKATFTGIKKTELKKGVSKTDSSGHKAEIKINNTNTSEKTEPGKDPYKWRWIAVIVIVSAFILVFGYVKLKPLIVAAKPFEFIVKLFKK